MIRPSLRRSSSAVLASAAVCTLAALPARAEPKRAAVLEMELAPGVKIDRTYFSDLARGAIKKAAPALFVMTRESTEALLQANGKTMADCAGECEVEVGRKLGADYLVSGRITRIGTRLVLSFRLFSTGDGALLGDEEADARTEDELLDGAKAAAARLAAPLGKLAAKDPPPPLPASCRRGAIAGRELAVCPIDAGWADARAACARSGWAFGSIRSAGEQGALRALIQATGEAGARVWWLGLRRASPGGPFAWTDGSPLAFAAWNDGEPNNGGTGPGSRPEECVTVWGEVAGFSGSLRWNDVSCDDLTGLRKLGWGFGFVCTREREAP